jgi:hypothetical protein
VVDPTDEHLRHAATNLKVALDAIDRVHWEQVHIDAYPRGACGHCAELLAFHLNQRFGIVPDYVCRVFYGEDGGHLSSHAWLDLNGLILDISGDQFGWPAVIVTRDSPLHDRGRDEERHRWALDPRWWGQYCGEIWRAAEVLMPREAEESTS